MLTIYLVYGFKYGLWISLKPIYKPLCILNIVVRMIAVDFFTVQLLQPTTRRPCDTRAQS